MPYSKKSNPSFANKAKIRQLVKGLKKSHKFNDSWDSAESEGFEPPVQLPVHRISSAARSTTLAAFLVSAIDGANV